jgi:hypothetical protein
MGSLEDAAARRWSGARIALGSLALGAGAVLPLALYVVFGPKDGNPIGLGLLAVAGVPIAAVGVLVGVVKLLVERFTRGAQ